MNFENEVHVGVKYRSNVFCMVIYFAPGSTIIESFCFINESIFCRFSRCILLARYRATLWPWSLFGAFLSYAYDIPWPNDCRYFITYTLIDPVRFASIESKLTL